MNYRFEFGSYGLSDRNELSFTYRYRGDHDDVIKEFCERFQLPENITFDVNDMTMQRILQHFHIIVGISYYKSLRGDVIHSYEISETEAAYYNAIYDKGLGEYKYINKLIETITPFVANSDHVAAPIEFETSGAILGIGGGKDSIVAGELLKSLGIQTSTLDMATRDNHGQAGSVMKIMGLPELHVGRYVDVSIKPFTEQYGGMSGHIPLSTIIAWLGVLIAYATRTQYVVVANEGATSTGNTVWNGHEVNHQWAKSLESERLTQQFVMNEVTGSIMYFSPIRPYGSLVIMELLARLGKQYLGDFTSCNLVLRIDPDSRPNGRWCTRCAKCLSTWILLSYWLDAQELESIFERNLWDDITLRENLEELLGLSGHKPLDCVGTVEELRAVTRKILADNAKHALLNGLTPAMIPGPAIQELLDERFDHSIPMPLSENIEALVTQLV